LNVGCVSFAYALNPIFIYPVKICAPCVFIAVPPPFTAFDGYNKLPLGSKHKFYICPVALNVGGKVSIFKYSLSLDFKGFTGCGAGVQFVNIAISAPFVFRL
ncbi:MAG: hypothetical protein ACOYJB_10845, partial [Christensenellaceae bacterium]